MAAGDASLPPVALQDGGVRHSPAPPPDLPKMAAAGRAPPLGVGSKMAGGGGSGSAVEPSRVVEALELLLGRPAGPGPDGVSLRLEALRDNAAALEERLRGEPGWAALRGLRAAVLGRAPALAAGAEDEAEPAWAAACAVLALLLCLKERLEALSAAPIAPASAPGAAPPPAADTLSAAQGQAVRRALRAAVGLGLAPYLPPGVGRRPGLPAPPLSPGAARGARLRAATAALVELARHPALGTPLLAQHLGPLLAGLCLLGHGPAVHCEVGGPRPSALSCGCVPAGLGLWFWSSRGLGMPSVPVQCCSWQLLVSRVCLSVKEQIKAVARTTWELGVWRCSLTARLPSPLQGLCFSRAFQKQSEQRAGRPCSTFWTVSISLWPCGSCSSCREAPSRYQAAGPSPGATYGCYLLFCLGQLLNLVLGCSKLLPADSKVRGQFRHTCTWKVCSSSGEAELSAALAPAAVCGPFRDCLLAVGSRIWAMLAGLQPGQPRGGTHHFCPLMYIECDSSPEPLCQ